MVSDATSQPLLGIQDVVKTYGRQSVLRGIRLTIHENDRLGLIGRNGCGKSTLLKILAGEEVPEEGCVTRRQGLRVALLHQDPPLDGHHTVGDFLTNAMAEIHRLLDKHHTLATRLSVEAPGPSRDVLAAEYERVQHALRVREGWNVDAEVDGLITALKVPPRERRLETLSGGELRRLQLASTLATRPDVLLLDEPTNHIDAESAEWIEDFLTAYPGSCVLVTHDRYFLDRIVTRIVELDEGQLLSVKGNYETFLERKGMLEEHAQRTEANRQAAIRRELAWLRRGPKARGTKQKARIKRFEEMDSISTFKPAEALSFEILSPKRLGNNILEAEGVSLCLDGRTLFRDFSLIMQKDMRVGVIGPNGCGKTSLLRVLMGQLEPEAGKVLVGDATEFLYVDQSHETVNPTITALEFISNGVRDVEINERRIHIPAYLEQFLFDRSVMNMEMQYLSGGERNRLDLAKKLMTGGNFLVLDEPTNDLDLPTLRVLEEMVQSFGGCALIVSHDRYFLNRVCTHMVAFGEGPELVTVAGNYDDYLRYCSERKRSVPSAESLSARPEPRPIRKETPRRLTWREKRELETIEGSILEAEERVRALQHQVNAPVFYKGPVDEVRRVLAELEEAEKRVHELYTRWSELDTVANQPS